MQVFGAIRKAKPPKLYIAADGARSSREGEAEKVKAVRDYVLNNIDWDCSVQTLFREKNLGCKYAVSSGITWFFENEEMGIVLEDDCLPSQSFFWFCEELLGRYKGDMRIWHIGGTNLQKTNWRGDGDYYFSKYSHVWGWASWANRWKYYDVELDNFKNSNLLDGVFEKPLVIKYWTNLFDIMKEKKINTWDYQWVFTIWKNEGLALLPNVNMVSNIGFGSDATHTKNYEQAAENFELTVSKHPSQIVIDNKADEFTFEHHYRPKSIFERIIKKLKKYFYAK